MLRRITASEQNSDKISRKLIVLVIIVVVLFATISIISIYIIISLQTPAGNGG